MAKRHGSIFYLPKQPNELRSKIRLQICIAAFRIPDNLVTLTFCVVVCEQEVGRAATSFYCSFINYYDASGVIYRGGGQRLWESV